MFLQTIESKRTLHPTQPNSNMNCNTYDIEHFYSELIKMEEIQTELKDKFGLLEAEKIINQFQNGIHSEEIKGNFEDIIINLIEGDDFEIERLYGWGPGGHFPIALFNFGPLYWVEAQEFDPVKFFETEEAAMAYAVSEYESFLNPDDDDDE